MLTSRALFKRRQQRTRAKLNRKIKRPRLSIFRSSKHIYAQIIDDTLGVTLAAASTLDKDIKGKVKTGAELVAALPSELRTLDKQKFLDKSREYIIPDLDGDPDYDDRFQSVKLLGHGGSVMIASRLRFAWE